MIDKPVGRYNDNVCFEVTFYMELWRERRERANLGLKTAGNRHSVLCMCV